MSIDHDHLVEDLAVEHRAKAAMRSLMDAGTEGTPAVRRGLHHPLPAVRARCCDILDHFLDADAIPDLMENLRHHHPWVRARALHALACDRCKEGECRPSEDDVLAVALRLLTEDPHRFVRKAAVEALGPAVHRSEEALRAVVAAHGADPDPLVRKVAGWYCPGGPISERLRPRVARKEVRRAVPAG
jgi:HEAT repeat protein